jgi:hypothetical protein
MAFYALLEEIRTLLERRGRVTYSALKLQFQLHDDQLEALKDELIEAERLAVDEQGKVLVWAATPTSAPPSVSPATPAQERPPLTYTPAYMAERILTSQSALAGERKQVTVLFAEIKDSTELIKDLDPEVGQAYTHAQELGRQVGDTSQLIRGLGGLGSFHQQRGELRTTRALHEQRLTLAQGHPDPVVLMDVYLSLGICVYFLGEFPVAEAHLEQALALVSPRLGYTDIPLERAALRKVKPVSLAILYPKDGTKIFL